MPHVESDTFSNIILNENGKSGVWIAGRSHRLLQFRPLFRKDSEFPQMGRRPKDCRRQARQPKEVSLSESLSNLRVSRTNGRNVS